MELGDSVNKKIKFAIVGTSGVASAHICAIRRNPNAEVTAIYSRDPSRAECFARKYSLKAAKTYDEILNDNSLSAVDIITEPGRHAKFALSAIASGKNVLIEKPIDIDLQSAELLMNAALQAKTKTSVISQKRFEREVCLIKEALDARKIGKPYLAQAMLIWKRTDEYYKSGNGWRGRDGNILINQAIHWIDIAIWFFGIPVKIKSMVTRVRKSIDCYDTAICSFEFADGVLFNLVASTAAKSSQKDEFRIYGSKGLLDYGSLQGDWFKSFISSRKGPFQCQVDDFISSIINDKPPAVSVKDAYNALKAVKDCEIYAK